MPTIGPPARPARAYEAVIEQIVAYIASEQLQPGDRLAPERDLARDLDVSRSTLRQALTVLRVVGVVDVRHGVGIHLVRRVGDRAPPLAGAALLPDPLTPAIDDLREALECHAAWLAAARRTDGDLAELTAADEQMAAEIGGGAIGLAGDRRFHAAVLAAARSPLLAARLGELDEAVHAIAAASLARPDQPPRSLATHRRILAAIAAGDGEQARRIMLEHLLGAVQPPA